MKKFFCLTLIFIFMFSVKVFAAENLNLISVSGEGIIETSPDSATISVGVVCRNKDAAKVQNDSAKISADIINSVVALGVERKNIRTGNYNFQQIFRNDNGGKNIFDGYEVTNSVTIFVDDIKLVGKIIDTSLSHGANKIDSLQFGLRDKKNFQVEAIKLAIRDAKSKAEIVARELGKNIIGVKNISVSSSSISSPRVSKMAMMATSDMANFETQIESGSLTCSASVHVEFIMN